MTTLQNIVQSIKNSNLLPWDHVNAGFSAGLVPPTLSVMNYEHTGDYDTSGFARKQEGLTGYVITDATFDVIIIHKSCDEAETLAAQVDQFLDLSTTLTPEGLCCFQENYKSSQMEEQLAGQWGVVINYKLTSSF